MNWKQLNINKQNIKTATDRAVFIAVPRHSEYSGFCFWHPAKLVNTGLNLQCSHNVIFADHTFDYAERLQAEARVYRMGQSYNVDYYNFNCNCGLDRLIRGCLKKKTNLLQEVKYEIEKKGAKEWLKTI